MPFNTKIETMNCDEGPTVKEQNGQWYWADEAWDWHGPSSSRSSAQRRQSLYYFYLSGEINIVLPKDWEMRKDRESEDSIHPCNVAEPWDCDCAGSCGCHFERDDTATSCLQIGTGGSHSDSFYDDGVCQYCGLTKE